MSDRARLWKRGALLTYIFANQGYGSLVGSLVTMITLAAYKGAMDNANGGSKTDGGALSRPHRPRSHSAQSGASSWPCR